MTEPHQTRHLADPVRLTVLHATFMLTVAERKRRRGRQTPSNGWPTHDRRTGDERQAARLGAALEAHVAGLASDQLAQLHRQLAYDLLREIDRRMATTGTPPGDRFDFTRMDTEAPAGLVADSQKLVALVSLPWMSPAMPSIQLATLAAALAREGIESDVLELYVDYGTRIGLNLYSHLGNLLGYLPEWVFSRHYYGPEHGDDLSDMIERRPLDDIPWPELADAILEALEPATADFIDSAIAEIDARRHDVVGCSLTISQLGSSMAFARRIKLAHPSLRVVFGGSQCAGVMGAAVMRACPYVDVVVHIEGELVFPEVVRRLRDGASLAGLPGVSFRGEDGAVITSPDTELYKPGDEKLPVDYDAYFRRLIRLGVQDKMNPWLPFESSRGCWYGQKNQCTFCGLHEIMEFRAWRPSVVLGELERLEEKYGFGRFYSMDLIMPREYLHTLFPEIVRRGHDWMFFYEMKANMRRHELETLAAAGVRWVQPGIESLDGDLLRIMRKGVSATQNIQLLKWCAELEIFCGWNLLCGLPGETEAPYARMAALIPKLVHLQPPSGGGQFQLHRFSPYFDHPDAYGLRWTGAHHMFGYAFPLSKHELDELVYLHEFELGDGAAAIDVRGVESQLIAWQSAYRAGATLEITTHPDGTSTIVDARNVEVAPHVHQLSAAETELYGVLDAGIAERKLDEVFADEHREGFAALGYENGLWERVETWQRRGLVVTIDGRLLGVALYAARMSDKNSRTRASQLPAADTPKLTLTATGPA